MARTEVLGGPADPAPSIPRWPHPRRLSPRAAVAIQRRWATRVLCARSPGPIRFVAGLDAAFSPDARDCLAAAVLWDLRLGRVVEQTTATCQVTMPYIPGLLTFREAPALLSALRALPRLPDVLLCDGHGLAHPRRFGIACHLGVLCDLRSVGCAKNRLTGTEVTPGIRRGDWAPLEDRGDIIGSVVRTQDCVRPVYVSVGHRMDLRAARGLVLRCGGRYRLPEPTRLADILVASAKRERYER